ncbi:hypothetical protein IKB17_01325 [bacterium]|nr:hypothetical protein [bacterium]
MKTELSAEEIVTKLLSSNEILRKHSNSSYIPSHFDLNKYLKNASLENQKSILNEPYDIKYKFIKK